MEYHFRYSLTADDFAEYNAYTSWHAPWQKKAKLKYLTNTGFYFFISMVATVIIIDKIKSDKTNFKVLLIVGIVIALIFTYFSYYQVPYRVKNKARKFLVKEENSHILNETDIEISEDGIINTNKESRVHQKWSSITRYAITREYFFLYTNSIQAQIIPKRLFTSQKEIDEFDKFLTEKISLSSSFRSIGI